MVGHDDHDHGRLVRVVREEHGRVVATLTRYLGSIDLAGDAASEACVVALETWPPTAYHPTPARG